MKQWYRAYEHVHDSRHCIEDSEDEKLFVAKANTVIQPRIVVVHTQHTLTTAGAMLTSIWLKIVTEVAVPSSMLVDHLEIRLGPAGI